MDHEGPVLRDVTAQHINVAGRQSKSTVCISEDYPTMEMTGEHMRVSLSALQPECEFQTAAQGYRNPIHETNPRYCEATTVENRRTSHRADTRSTRRCEEKHTIYSQWRIMPIMYCTITLLVHASHFDAEHREESPTPLSTITITASTHTERQTQFLAS
jgi:hypothetical protein